MAGMSRYAERVKDWIVTGGGDDHSLVRISTAELARVVDHTVARVRK